MPCIMPSPSSTKAQAIKTGLPIMWWKKLNTFASILTVDAQIATSALCRSSYKIDWPDLVSSSVSKFPQVSPESVLKEPLRAALVWAAGQSGWVGCIRQAAERLVLSTQCSAVDVTSKTEQAHCCCCTYTCSAACMLDWHLWLVTRVAFCSCQSLQRYSGVWEASYTPSLVESWQEPVLAAAAAAACAAFRVSTDRVRAKCAICMYTAQTWPLLPGCE